MARKSSLVYSEPMRLSGPSFGGAWRALPRCTATLLLVLTGVYVVQGLARALLDLHIASTFGLSAAGLLRGQFWQFITYMFLHGSALHLLLNLLMLYFLGQEVERTVGPGHLLAIFLLSGVLGGVGWLGVTYPYEGICVGASGAIFGLLSAFAVLHPHREVTLLLFMVLPVTMRAWTLAVGMGAVQLLFMLSPESGGIAYAAHVAGALAGLVYTLTVFRGDRWQLWSRRWRDRWRHRDERRHEAGRAEVDRLLEKVASEGLHALTPRERRRLEQASEQLRETRPR